MNNTLLVIGAGPKALALQAKATVMHALNRDHPNVVIVEQHEPGANWSGRYGYTDGEGEVVTLPERDLGFPYESTFGTQVDRGMGSYSWSAYLIATRLIANWIDERRPLIKHGELSRYLAWVANETNADIRPGVVDGPIRSEGDEWIVPYRPPGQQGSIPIRAGSIVITGPGKPRRLPGSHPDHPTILDSQSFWLPSVIADLKKLKNGSIAVVGSGDTAAAVVVTLLRILPASVDISLFCAGGFALSRGESRGETKWLTNPTGWDKMPESGRREFIKHTERGVFSGVLKERIDNALNVRERNGYVYHAEIKDRHVRLTLNVGERNNARHLKALAGERFNRLIVATGFKRCTFEEWFRDKSQFPSVRRRYEGYDSKKEELVSRLIQPDLSYRNERGWPRPKLFLPTMAGFNCGPGFSSLGCLGHMSDRIIESHLAGPL